MKILLVEDDIKISSFVKFGLEENGYNVTVAYDSDMAEKFIYRKTFDVIILDVIIPGINGFCLCKKIRNAGITTPILILSSLDDVEDKIEGLNCGSDDYMVKPFIFKELIARIKALTRRQTDTNIKSTLKIANLELDTGTKKVKRDNHEIRLTAKEFEILELMLRNEGKVLDRIEIAEKVWGYAFNSGTNIIDVYISSLRKKIDKNSSQKLIHTFVGCGYVITAGA